MRRRYEDKENIPVRQESMQLRGKNQGYSAVPPLKIQNCDSVENLSRFRKRDFIEDQPYSPSIIYGISKVSWRPNSPNCQPPECFPSIFELSRMIEQISQRIQSLPVDADTTKIRLIHRLLILIERILSPDRLDEDVLIIGRKEEANSIELLGDVYEFYIQEKQKEITMLKTRLETKETETLSLQKKIMDIMLDMDKLRWEVEGVRKIDDTIVKMHSEGSQSSLKLQQFSECYKEPFIKVCSQYTKEDEIHSVDFRWIKSQNVNELFMNESVLEDSEIEKDLSQVKWESAEQQKHRSNSLSKSTAINTFKILKQIKVKEEKECQTVDLLAPSQCFREIEEIPINHMVSIEPTFSERLHQQPQINEPVCRTFRSSMPQNSKLSVVSTLYSLSLEHKTKDIVGLIDFKNLLMQLTDTINMTWTVLLKLRQVNKSTGDRRCKRDDLKKTKDLIESFEKWFNDQYGYYSREGTQPAVQFYQEANAKVEQFVKSMSLLVSSAM